MNAVAFERLVLLEDPNGFQDKCAALETKVHTTFVVGRSGNGDFSVTNVFRPSVFPAFL